MSEFDFRGITRRKMNTAKLQPLIITCAITGANQGKETNPNLPELPEEQAQSMYEAYQAGATMVHVHARQPDNPAQPSTDPEDYKKINHLIREKCPDLIIGNTGGGGATLTFEQKCAAASARPEMMSIDLACWPLLLHYKKRESPLFGRDEDVYINTVFGISHAEAEQTMEYMNQYDVRPAIEVYDTANFEMVQNLLDKGLLTPPYWFDFVMGVGGGGSYPTPYHLMTMLEYLPENSLVSVIGVGASQWPLLATAIAMGCHVRVGMEDNIYIEKGKLASSNAELVQKAVDIATILGRPIATPSQAREIMGLPQEPRQYS
ncbi:MAG: 3-keto-5-aminohexanoate cleavage protein [Lachnospiraceae bacterium]|nr:3-keto-5-aminohexanoate cleavage protein [Lachnospiraceae bacterium]